jgi:hypothetical protein
MKRTMSTVCLAAIVVLTISVAPGFAQTAGFQTGIIQGNFGPTYQNPQVPPRSIFIAVPVVPTWSIPPLPPNVLVPLVPNFAVPLIPNMAGVPLVPNFPTVIVPNHVIVPGTGIIPSQFVSPSPTAFVPTNPVLPPASVPFIPVFGGIGGAGRVVPIGTPREDVIRQFGSPSVTVITSTGETLYFTGNVTVIIQNGVVTSQR